MDLIQLQNVCKRDPECYEDDFKQQYQRFQQQLGLFEMNPEAKDASTFSGLITFLCHVSGVYWKTLKDLPQKLIHLLQEYGHSFDKDLRVVIVRGLILIRNKQLIDLHILLPLFFKLFLLPDKELRRLMYIHIITDIKDTSIKHPGDKSVKKSQVFLFRVLDTPSNDQVVSLRALDILVALYFRKIWTDARTVQAIAMACTHEDKRVKLKAIKFFIYSEMAFEEEEKEDVERAKQHLQRSVGIGCKMTRKRKTRFQRDLKSLEKKGRKQERESEAGSPNWPAIDLIYDPQSLAEQLLKDLKRTATKFAAKLLLIDLIARIVSVHKLILVNFYSFLQRYIRPSTEEITVILARLAQSVHDLVPPEELEIVINTLLHEFVSDRNADEAIAIGINTIREICARQPLVMNKTILRDLSQYRKYPNKGVKIAAKSLIRLFRVVHPDLLHKKDRSKESMDVKVREYGEVVVNDHVEGIELLGEDSDLSWDDIDDDDGLLLDTMGYIDDRTGEVIAPIPLSAESVKERYVDAEKILTEEEFSRIQKRKLELEEDGLEVPDEVDPGTIMGYQKRRKLTREERAEERKGIREERFKHDPDKRQFRGVTNEEKARNQPFMLQMQSKRVQEKKRKNLARVKVRGKQAGGSRKTQKRRKH